MDLVPTIQPVLITPHQQSHHTEQQWKDLLYPTSAMDHLPYFDQLITKLEMKIEPLFHALIALTRIALIKI